MARVSLTLIYDPFTGEGTLSPASKITLRDLVIKNDLMAMDVIRDWQGELEAAYADALESLKASLANRETHA
jgi:hypothetical protein